MFGHDHKDEVNNNAGSVQPMGTQPVHNGLLGIDDDAPASASNSSTSSPLSPPSPPSSSISDQYSDAPAPTPEPVTVSPAPSDEPESTPSPSVTPAAAEPVSTDNDDDLLDIKREALEELSPLIDHLDQDPEEKFRTSMMMIQASDNKTLVPQAFATAKQITDDKKRAQALLDIVNEINYFTHKTGE